MIDELISMANFKDLLFVALIANIAFLFSTIAEGKLKLKKDFN